MGWFYGGKKFGGCWSTKFLKYVQEKKFVSDEVLSIDSKKDQNEVEIMTKLTQNKLPESAKDLPSILFSFQGNLP